jgi:hypothetical protein
MLPLDKFAKDQSHHYAARVGARGSVKFGTVHRMNNLAV